MAGCATAAKTGIPAMSRFLDASFDPPVGTVTGRDILRIAPSLDGKMRALRIYDRYLRVSEAIGNYRAEASP